MAINNIEVSESPRKSRDPITSFRDRVVRVDPRDPIAVSKARAAIADRYDAKSQRTAPSINRIAAKRIHDFERYLEHRYGCILPDDDAGREDLMILANHVAQNRHDPHRKILGSIRHWAPWMAATEAEALTQTVLKAPRRYKATTLGGLLRLTREEQMILFTETIRPFDKSDAEMKEDRKRRDREDKKAKRAANSSGRPCGRPKSEGVKPWATLGISKATYHRRKKAAMSGTNGETKNASAALESSSYRADGISVSRVSTTGPSEGAPEAPPHRPIVVHLQDIPDGLILDQDGAEFRPPPPHQRLINGARHLRHGWTQPSKATGGGHEPDCPIPRHRRRYRRPARRPRHDETLHSAV
jgi:hypothetical protein